MKAKYAAIVAGTLALGMLAASRPLMAQDPYNPYSQREQQKPRKDKPADAAHVPAPSGPAPGESAMRDAIPAPVEKGELAPVMAGDGSGLPLELWKGLDLAKVEGLVSELEIPPRSPALHNLWKRLVTSNATPPAGGSSPAQFAALRLELLYRSGLANTPANQSPAGDAASDPVIAALSARNDLAAGQADKACATAQRAAASKGEVPARLKAQTILMNGYCAAIAKDAASAGLYAELARDAGIDMSPGLEALDAFALGAKPKLAAPKQWTLLDYKLVAVTGGPLPKDVLEKAEPALLAALSNDIGGNAETRLAAAEAAAKINALGAEDLAQAYRASPANEGADQLLAGGASKGATRRAALFKTAESEQTPGKRAKLIRAFVDDAKKNSLGFQALQVSAKLAASLNPEPDTAFFAETAAEIGLAAANSALLKRWIDFAGAQGGGINPLHHWYALADIADITLEPHGQYLSELEALAQHSRFSADALHRLATVLDALQYIVPIPLWDAASRTQQPNGGFLPATGVLSELQDAAKKKEFGRTVLLAMKALGPNGAEGAHLIALGDAIRALKRAGLEADARRLGLEALLASWPKTSASAN